MGDLSKNFNRSEFECKCGCGFDTVDAELLKVLQDLYDYIEKVYYREVAIRVTSGARCWIHNEEVGGSEKSQHLTGKAADIKVYRKNDKGEWVQVNAAYIDPLLNDLYPDKYGIGGYESFTHIDVRADKARWYE